MSADNFYVVTQNPVTQRWHLFMGFASDEDFIPKLHPDDPTYDTELDALHVGMNSYSEYGVSTGPWPEWFDVANACPTCRGTDDDCDDCCGFGFGVMPWDEVRAVLLGAGAPARFVTKHGGAL